jgi:hypothetical protein
MWVYESQNQIKTVCEKSATIVHSYIYIYIYIYIYYMPGSPLCLSTVSKALMKQLIMQRQFSVPTTVQWI